MARINWHEQEPGLRALGQCFRPICAMVTALQHDCSCCGVATLLRRCKVRTCSLRLLLVHVHLHLRTTDTWWRSTPQCFGIRPFLLALAFLRVHACISSCPCFPLHWCELPVIIPTDPPSRSPIVDRRSSVPSDLPLRRVDRPDNILVRHML